MRVNEWPQSAPGSAIGGARGRMRRGRASSSATSAAPSASASPPGFYGHLLLLRQLEDQARRLQMPLINSSSIVRSIFQLRTVDQLLWAPSSMQ
jgi:hypothetical protein